MQFGLLRLLFEYISIALDEFGNTFKDLAHDIFGLSEDEQVILVHNEGRGYDAGQEVKNIGLIDFVHFRLKRLGNDELAEKQVDVSGHELLEA